jgi:thymidylate synthase (FAD)
MEVKYIADNFLGLPTHLVKDLGVVTFEIKGISRVVLAQLVRHRTFSFSVQSMRYVQQNDDFIIPYDFDSIDSVAMYTRLATILFDSYDYLVKQHDIKKQEARYILPLATTTSLVVTMPVKYADNFFKLRLHKSAQPEMRALACEVFSKYEDALMFLNEEYISDELYELYEEAMETHNVLHYLKQPI